mmetsp:Transcript_24396/g.77890  ORF Transcript_24396/g.77890 Transcript_24396/m.77890 type:complete len:365 (+) Transcript_24396:333-1427(+)
MRERAKGAGEGDWRPARTAPRWARCSSCSCSCSCSCCCCCSLHVHGGVGNAHERVQVGAGAKAAGATVLVGRLKHAVMDLRHALLQDGVKFLDRAAHHLVARDHRAAVDQLAWGVEHLALLEDLLRVWRAAPVRALEHGHAPVVRKQSGVVRVELALDVARERNVAANLLPERACLGELLVRGLGVLLKRARARLDVRNVVNVSLGEALLVVDVASLVAERDGHGALLDQLESDAAGQGAGAGQKAHLVLEGGLEGSLHGALGKVNCAEARRLGKDLARAEQLVDLLRSGSIVELAEGVLQAGHFELANAKVGLERVDLRTDEVAQLVHEALAEAADLGIRLVHWVKVRSATGPAQREAGDGVF